MGRRRHWFSAVAVAGLLLGATTPPATAAPAVPAQPTGFVAASGPGLVVDGQPWRFVGYNLPCAQPFLLDQGQLPFVLATIANNSHANALRVWFFQHNGGPGNWAPFDRLVAAAKADGLRLVPTLVNEWPTCEANPPITALKSLPWYQGGYRQAGDGYPVSFHDYAVAVAAHFANDPTIAFWQLVNEAEAPILSATAQATCDETAAAHALRSFGDDMAGALHAADPHHLVSLGTLGGSQCGSAGTDYPYIHAGAVDLCEYHDYSDPLNPLGAGQTDGLAARTHQCAALPGGGKPIFVGESGIVPNVHSAPGPEPVNCSPWPTCSPTPVSYDSLNLRAALFKAKIIQAFSAGVSGYLIWFKGPQFSATNDSFAIGNGDPTEVMMSSLSLGTSTTATVPPRTPAIAASATTHQGKSWNTAQALLVAACVLLVVIGLVTRLRRRRRQRPTEVSAPPAEVGAR